MARFFEKHRLTRERLEASATLLLDKLKALQVKGPPVQTTAAASSVVETNGALSARGTAGSGAMGGSAGASGVATVVSASSAAG